MQRPSFARRAVVVLLSAGAVAVAAASCGDTAEPTAAPTPSVTTRLSFDFDGDGRLSATEEAIQRAVLAARDALRARDKAAFEQVLAQWRTYADTATSRPFRISWLYCAPQPRRAAVATIGPLGGTIAVGPHRLRVPAGAVLANTEIRAETGGEIVGVDFAPHGLRFAVPVELTLSYAHCHYPANGEPDFHVAYAGADSAGTASAVAQALAIQPSLQHDDADVVVALTDHFSNYRLAKRNVYAVSYQILRSGAPATPAP